MYAAITGDIIASKHLDLTIRDELITLLGNDFSQLNSRLKLQYPFSFVRGDSFQGVTTQIKDALNIALQIKCIFKKNLKSQFGIIGKSDKGEGNRKNWRIYNNLDARISIGIGPIEYLKDELSLSDGTALQFSGRELEQMKHKGLKLALLCTNADINRELSVELKLLDAIIDKWTVMSAEVVYFLLQGYNETETARLLNISQSAINQRKRTANWDAINTLLSNFNALTTQL